MRPEQYTLKLIDLPRTDPRLGRRVHHDSRSLRFLEPPVSLDGLVSVKYESNIPVLDQGTYLDPTTGRRIALGSCTGNAGTKALSYGNVRAALQYLQRWPLSTTDADEDESYAVGVYSAATKIDPFDGFYPPEDTGSDGLSIGKVLKARGLIAGYTHGTSLAAVLGSLVSKGPGITGTVWKDGMFDPRPSGELFPIGADAGGHEYVLDEVDVENRRVWMQNSWSQRWGLGGRAWFSWDAYETLLLDDGDYTAFTPVSQPPPTPGPAPVPEDPDEVFAKQLTVWLDRKPWFYKPVQSAARRWLMTKDAP